MIGASVSLISGIDMISQSMPLHDRYGPETEAVGFFFRAPCSCLVTVQLSWQVCIGLGSAMLISAAIDSGMGQYEDETFEERVDPQVTDAMTMELPSAPIGGRIPESEMNTTSKCDLNSL